MRKTKKKYRVFGSLCLKSLVCKEVLKFMWKTIPMDDWNSVDTDIGTSLTIKLFKHKLRRTLSHFFVFSKYAVLIG